MANTPLPWGDDGAVPVESPYNNWHNWALVEIWMGQDASGKFIPKINDYVTDYNYGITYKVTALSDLYVPTLSRVTPLPIASMDSEDLLLGETKDAYRCFIDKTVMPYRLQVDARCYVNARNASTARVYRGDPINQSDAEIISLVLDQSGKAIGTQIPLQLGVMPNGINKAQYYVPTAYTTTDIEDGEFLYVVLFDDTGAVLSSKELRAVVSSFTASTDQSIAAVTAIALEGPLMSKTIPGQMEVPLNLTLNSVDMTGVVTYNSGLPKRRNVDGTQFQLLGMSTYTPTQAGQKFQMDLKYNLAAGEVSYLGSQVGGNRFITVPITVLTTDVENQLSVKLYPYPVWQDPVRGYTLRWFLTNLDRDTLVDVTPLIELGASSPALDPTLYGIKQSLSYVIDLSKVNGSWRAYRFPQTVDITLMRVGGNFDGTAPLWSIGFDPGQSPAYGALNYGNVNVIKSQFINQNLCVIDMHSGYGSVEEWLDNFYNNTKPLYDPQLEDGPIIPDYVIFSDGGNVNKIRLKISDYWNQKFEVTWPVLQDQTVFLTFVKQGTSSDLILSQAGIPVQQVQSWS